jgi:hypothetical protein
MAWQRRCAVGVWVVQDRVAATLTKDDAAGGRQVTQQIAAFYPPRSHLNRDGLAPGGAGTMPLGECAVSLEDHGEGFLQIAPRFLQCPALGVDAGNFFNVGNVPTPALLVHGGIFALQCCTPLEFNTGFEFARNVRGGQTLQQTVGRASAFPLQPRLTPLPSKLLAPSH